MTKILLKYKLIGVTLISTITLIFSLTSCDPDEVGDSYFTFTGEMVYTYLKKDTTNFSEFIKVMDKAKISGLLNAYGSYTCFAPTNRALREYYKSLGSSFSFDSLSTKQIVYIAKTHLISKKYLTSQLTTGAIPTPNMNERYILINFSTDSLGKFSIMLNNESRILNRDIEVENGVIHVVNAVLKPSTAQIPDLLTKNENLSIFYEALFLTGMSDSLRMVEDDNYTPILDFPDISGSGNVASPEYRKFGYTLLVETNQVFAKYGITKLSELIEKAKQWYPENAIYEGKYTNRNNSLNKFISYHLIERTIQYNKFISTYNSVANQVHFDFIETMLPNTILKVNDSNEGLKINQDKSRNLDGITILSMDEHSSDQSALNGVYHLIDNILIYDEKVEDMLLNIRIRFDISSVLPELTTNGIRGENKRICLPQGYSKYLKFSSDSKVYYLEPHSNWMNYQGDEMMALGSYDITFRLPPVPAGTYELRFGYTANVKRGVAQIYVDSKPVGIPLDIRILASNPKIGWVVDASTMDNGIENDKMMRNRGYLKGPDTYWSPTGNMVARDHDGSLRRIVGTFTFNSAEPHYIRFKSVLEDPLAQFMMDYIEYVPKNVYSNPNGEDRH